MLLQLKLDFFKNKSFEYTGLDSVEECCVNRPALKKHFLSYPHKVTYHYNERGFRDIKWPGDIDEKTLFCFGDSFTVGLGCPIEHTWVHLLRETTKRTCINISMDGASNNFLKRKMIYTMEKIKPKNLIVQWSYVHRREHGDDFLDDMARRIWFSDNANDEEDFNNTLNCIQEVELCAKKTNTKIVHTFIPFFAKDEYAVRVFQYLDENNFCYVKFEQIDKARDSHHYDIQTSRQLVENIVKSGFLNV